MEPNKPVTGTEGGLSRGTDAAWVEVVACDALRTMPETIPFMDDAPRTDVRTDAFAVDPTVVRADTLALTVPPIETPVSCLISDAPSGVGA